MAPIQRLFFCHQPRSHTGMPNRPKDYSSLPDWPRLMSADLACRYVGYSRNGFLKRVGKTWPEPIRLGGKVLWDRKALDEAIDRLSLGAEPLADPFEKALDRLNQRAKPLTDPVMEAIKGMGQGTGSRKGRRRP